MGVDIPGVKLYIYIIVHMGHLFGCILIEELGGAETNAEIFRVCKCYTPSSIALDEHEQLQDSERSRCSFAYTTATGVAAERWRREGSAGRKAWLPLQAIATTPVRTHYSRRLLILQAASLWNCGGLQELLLQAQPVSGLWRNP